MRLLLDTHCWLWLESAPERLSERVRQQLVDSETELLLSVVSVWELAIKTALGKLATLGFLCTRDILGQVDLVLLLATLLLFERLLLGLLLRKPRDLFLIDGVGLVELLLRRFLQRRIADLRGRLGNGLRRFLGRLRLRFRLGGGDGLLRTRDVGRGNQQGGHHRLARCSFKGSLRHPARRQIHHQ